MSDEEAICPDCPPPGSPGWMGTFADLMSLLMCFFVLLLSFAEMDAMKFKRLAGSMSQAFGVQNKLQVKDPPKGTSIIAQEFSPGRPDPTPINEIYQHTDSLTELSLEVDAAEEFDVENEKEGEDGKGEGEGEAEAQVEVVEQIEQLIKETERDAMDLAKALNEEISKGEVEIETQGRQIIVRIREKGSFGSGSSTLANNYVPLLQEVSSVLATKSGMISVQGHTDDIPIKTSRFRSNWELSTSRAVSVAQELLASGIVNPRRLQVSGFAATRPLASNESGEGRSKNRRVEIVIQQGLGEKIKEELQDLKQTDPDYYKSLELEPDSAESTSFDLDAGDIF